MAFHARLVERFFLFAAVLSGALTLSIFAFMFIHGLPLLTGGHFFSLLSGPWQPVSGEYGILPMLVGSVVISLLSLLFALPLSLGTACLVGGLAPPLFARLLRKVVEAMTGIPTVIYGFVAIFLLVPFMREIFARGSGMCVLSAALVLAILISPTMILFFSDSFARVPVSYGQAADALGARPAQKLLYVVLPHAWRGMLTAIILALGRALGDTLIALMIAGNAVQVPHSLLDSARTLTAHIALVFAADYDSLEFKAIFACGLVLYCFTTVLAIGARALARKGEGR